MRFNGFLCVWDQIPVTIFARKDISWRVRKLNAKQNRFQIVTIFKTFSFSIFLRHYVTFVPAGFGKVLIALILGCHGRIQRGGRGSGPPPPPPPEKSQKIGLAFCIRAWLYFKELYFLKIYKSVYSNSTPVTLDFCCTTFLDEFPCR